MDTRLQHPFTCILAGPSNCGKSWFVRKLLENARSVLSHQPSNIVWIYSCWQPLYGQLQTRFKHLRFVEGLPESLNDDALLPPSEVNLLIVDDLMCEGGQSGELEKAFTQYSHHRNLSICYIVQNVFNKGKSNRSISLNASYIVLFKNPRDKQQLSVIARQMYPTKTRFFMEAYDDAVGKPYGYLLIDLKTTTTEEYRLRTGIFPPDLPVVYIPKKPSKNQH